MSDSDRQSVVEQLVELADKALGEATRLATAAMEPDNTPKVAAGAAIGAVAGLVIPFIAWPIAALAGAGYVAYQQAKKQE